MKLHQTIYGIFAGGIVLCLVMIIGALCYRVMVDGNSAITETITTELLYLGGGAFLAILGLFGLNRFGPMSSTAIPPAPTLPTVPDPTATPTPPATPITPQAGS